MADCSQLICSECQKELSTMEYIACKQCNKKFHCYCADLPNDLGPMLKKIQKWFSWSCKTCENSPNQPSPSDNLAITPLLPDQRASCAKWEMEASDNLAVTPLLSDQTASCAKWEMDSGKEENPTCESYTKVKIKSAKNVYNYITYPQLPQLQEALQLQCSDVEENMITSFIKAPNSRLGNTEANVSASLSEGTKVEYPIQYYFAELKVEENLPGLPSRKRTIGLNEIFHTQSDNVIRMKQNILITGDAGFGKTTLAKKLYYDWATVQAPDYMSDFDLVVSIALRNMGNEPIEKIIMNEVRSSTENVNQKTIMSKELRILIILDGFDEIGEQSNIISFLEDRSLDFNGCSISSTVIVTSSPYDVKDIHHLFNRRLSISSLSHANQDIHIRNMLPNAKAEIVVKDMIKYPLLRKIAECPFMLHLMCEVYDKEGRSLACSLRKKS